MKIRQYLYSTIILLFIGGCANMQPPSGGPPDKTPPVVLEFEPKNNTIDFRGKYITLYFNKYLDKNKVIENITISPPVKLKYDWSGKELEIKFNEKLDSNTSYVFSLGTDYTDLHGNKPDEAFSIVFSTGKNLDSGEIKGKLFSESPAGAYIFGYNLSNLNPDTLNPFHTTAQYFTQVGTNGFFSLKALKKGKYRVFAVKKAFKGDYSVNEGDIFGAAPNDISIADSVGTVNLMLGKIIDTTGPMLYDVRPINNYRIEAEFSERIDTFSFSNANFILSDTLEKRNVPIVSSFISLDAPEKIVLTTSEKMDSNIFWRLKAIKTEDFKIKDTSGVPLNPKSKHINFKNDGFPDTLKPLLVKLPFKDSTFNIPLKPDLKFYFNLGLKDSVLTSRVIIKKTSDGQPVSFLAHSIAGNILLIELFKKLESNTLYELDIKLDSLSFFPNKYFPDSTLKLHFKTLDDRNNGSATGIIKNLPQLSGNFIMRFISKETKRVYTCMVSDSGKWNMPSLPAGNYNIETFCDMDYNRKYSYGNPFPFKEAEPFCVFDIQITIKARWSLDDVILQWK